MHCMFHYLQSPSSKVQTISKSDRHCSKAKSETLHCESLGVWGVGWGTLDNCLKKQQKHYSNMAVLELTADWSWPWSQCGQCPYPGRTRINSQTMLVDKPRQNSILPHLSWKAEALNAIRQPSQPHNVQTKKSCLMWEGAETATVTEGPITDTDLSQTAAEAPVTESDRGTCHRQQQRHLSQTVTEAPVTESDRGTCDRQWQRHPSQTATEGPTTDSDRGTCHRQRQRHLS